MYGVGGHLAIDDTLTVGTLLALGDAAAAAARPAAGPVQRPDRRDDRAGQLRAGLRGARPALADRGEAGRRSRCRASAARLEFDHVAFSYPRADEISLASLESVARTESRDSGQVLADIIVHRRARARWSRWSGPSGAGKTTITHLVARLYDAEHRRGPRRRPRRTRRDPAVAGGRRRLRHPGRPHVPRHDPAPTCSTPVPAPTDPEVWAALEAAQIAPLVRSLPDGLDTVVGDRGYRLSGGERQRLAIARLLLKAPVDRRARRGDRAPRQRVRGGRAARARRRAGGPHLAGDRAPALDGPQRRPDPGRRRRPDRPVAAPTPTLLAEGGLYADLYRTQFIEDLPRLG